MDQQHPMWCAPRRCRATLNGSHKSDPVESIHGTNRVSAWLQQHPADETLLALVTAYRGIGTPVVYLQLPQARTLLHGAWKLVNQTGDDKDTRP
jgi:hypothetical protein